MIEIISSNYNGLHKHPSMNAWVEIVAYQRKDENWDVFIFEVKGSIPELESKRTDNNHIFFKTIQSDKELESIVKEIHTFLGEGYEPKVFFRESNSRKWIGRIFDHLKKLGKTGMSVQQIHDNYWEILVRKKDFPVANEVIASNLK